MSKKRPVYVSIPVGHVCLKVGDVLHQQTVIDARENENAYIRHTLYASQDENEGLKKQLAEAEKKIEELEDVLKSRTDAMLYWKRAHDQLKERIEAVKPDAETKEA